MDEVEEASNHSIVEVSSPTIEKPTKPKIKYDPERYDRSFHLSDVRLPHALEALKGTFQWPLAIGNTGEIINYYKEEVIEDDPHHGIDIAAPTGTQIVAAYGGKVLIREDSLRNPKMNKAMGDVDVFDEKTGLWQLYCHLDLGSIHENLRDGQQVQVGDLIGCIGKFEGEGFKLPDHLHYELEHSNLKFFTFPPIRGKMINPLWLLEDLRNS
jgi:murein DD-endopeptidase MepM/ murein hydrolase activator NlpD